MRTGSRRCLMRGRNLQVATSAGPGDIPAGGRRNQKGIRGQESRGVLRTFSNVQIFLVILK